ncbi:MAG TPA: class I SAM-dependent methyltransferase [Lentisphaeria bacterium]|nr:class I SAM-dependent methyltransferase [Lentisphaeria bacterium]
MTDSLSYSLLDTGAGRKLERFGDYVLDRPCAQAVWRPALRPSEWSQADAFFTREQGNRWEFRRPLPESWICVVGGIRFQVRPTDFGHIGVFPEHVLGWQWMTRAIAGVGRSLSVLNLFAYSGGATLALAKVGCEVCHLDAARKMVDWARRNAEENGLGQAPIRWIVDDVRKFLLREVRRGRRYDGIVLDPPSFGRGANQELFKIDDNLLELLGLCWQVLTPTPVFVFLSCHTPGYTPLVLQHLISQIASGGSLEAGEMVIEAAPGALPLPSGSYAAWTGSGKA